MPSASSTSILLGSARRSFRARGQTPTSGASGSAGCPGTLQEGEPAEFLVLLRSLLQFQTFRLRLYAILPPRDSQPTNLVETDRQLWSIKNWCSEALEADGVSLYVVLVDGDLKHLPVGEPVLPRVIAHNLSREAAGRSVAQLSNDSVEGEPTGCAPYVWEYQEPHANTEPDYCLECEEIVLEHSKHLLHLLEQEIAKRSLK